MLTFIVLQLIYIFFFFSRFPESFRNALDLHDGVLDATASWLSSLTMLGYCVICLVSVAQLVMKKSAFLLWFQISGAIALVGNFIVFVLRQLAETLYSSRYSSYYDGDYYWVLFIMALFWTIIWCMYFARSSRVYSYMGENPQYLQMALFTKNVVPPAPWEEPKPVYPVYPPVNPNAYPPRYNQPPAPQYPNAAQPPAGYQQPARPMAAPPPYRPAQQNAPAYPGYSPPQQQAAPPAYPPQQNQAAYPPPQGQGTAPQNNNVADTPAPPAANLQEPPYTQGN